jgi:hypothetical protein
MPKTSLGKVSNSGSIQYTNAGSAITKTNYGKITGSETSYDFSSSLNNYITNQPNFKYPQYKIIQQKDIGNNFREYTYNTHCHENTKTNKYNKNTFIM